MIQKDPLTGDAMRVNKEGRGWVQSVSESLQHHVSSHDGQAYQVLGTATLASGTVTALHIRNTSDTLECVITYIRCQVIDEAGGTALPSALTYTTVALGRTYDSAGAAVVPINVNTGSTNAAAITAYQSAPTLAGSGDEIDRQYVKVEAELVSYRKEGAVIIAPGGSLEVSLVTDHTSGTFLARVSFIMADPATLN